MYSMTSSNTQEKVRTTADAAFHEDRLSRYDLLVLLLLFVVSFGIRLAFLPIAPNNTTDAWSRFHDAELWLQNPGTLPKATSEGAWLPLHFWLLGSVLWLTKSEMSLRIFTALLGSLTVLIFWGIFRRAFDRRVALTAAALLALFDFHIAFSITTGSEVPTIFFMAVGTYAWLRFSAQPKFRWALLSAVMISLACLCRFEPWLCPAVFAFMLLDSQEGFSAAFRDQNRYLRALGFGLLASTGALGWMLFSFLKWGNPMELKSRTVWLNLHFRAEVLRHSLAFRVFEVPVSLATSLSPLILALACLGLLVVLVQRFRPARGLAVLVLVLFAFNFYSSVRYETTQARYTLLYSWLFFPFAVEALLWSAENWRRMKLSAMVAWTAIFFLVWQVGIIVGATYARPTIADRLGVMSPTVPLHHEMRGLTDWLLHNDPRASTIVLDDLNWDSAAISRFAHLDLSQTFHITPEYYSNHDLLRRDLEQFVDTRHPVLCVCSPYGLIGKMWSLDGAKDVNVLDPALHLHVVWQGEHWRVYTIEPKPGAKP